MPVNILYTEYRTPSQGKYPVEYHFKVTPRMPHSAFLLISSDNKLNPEQARSIYTKVYFDDSFSWKRYCWRTILYGIRRTVTTQSTGGPSLKTFTFPNFNHWRLNTSFLNFDIIPVIMPQDISWITARDYCRHRKSALIKFTEWKEVDMFRDILHTLSSYFIQPFFSYMSISMGMVITYFVNETGSEI